MKQQRLQPYIDLIQQLLACPKGEEWIILRQNEMLVTPELVQVMEQVVQQLANQGNLKQAKFLHNLAGQIHHLFMAQTVSPTSQDERSQVYLDFIQALLESSEADVSALLTEHQDLIGPGLLQMMQKVATQLATNGDPEAAQYLQQWATELNHLWLQKHNFQPDAAPAPPAPPAPAPDPEMAEDVWADPPTPPFPVPDATAVAAPPTVAPTESRAAAPPTSAPLPNVEISRHLAAIATALTRLSESLAPPHPANPLWYMDILEKAAANDWILTTTEVHELIGVKPICDQDSDVFQRGSWLFIHAGKVGAQNAWRVRKDRPKEE